MKIKYTIVKFGTWSSNEKVELYLDDNFERDFSSGTSCSNGEKEIVEFEISHSASTISVDFRTAFEQVWKYDSKSWGIADFYIYYENCE